LLLSVMEDAVPSFTPPAYIAGIGFWLVAVITATPSFDPPLYWAKLLKEQKKNDIRSSLFIWQVIVTLCFKTTGLLIILVEEVYKAKVSKIK